MKPNYDYATEMIKIAESQDHKKLFEPLEKLAFSREGKEEPSEVEAEMRKLNKQAKCECEKTGCKDCSCECHKDSAKADDGAPLEVEIAPVEVKAAAFPLNTVESLMKISMQLEAEGLEKVSAAALILAEAVVKEAKKKKEKAKSKSKSKSDSKSKSKKMTPKERMEAMRKAKDKGKASKEKSKSK